MSRDCNFCHRPDLTDDDFYSTRNICKQCAIRRNNARSKNLQAGGKCIECLGVAEPNSARCTKCKGLARARYHSNKAMNQQTAKARRQRLKLSACHAYGGPRCACCKDAHIEFLTIDHIDGQGARHRDELLRESGWNTKNRSAFTGSHFYLWLRQQGYPPGFRVLCMNCNHALAHFGYCPHQRSANTSQSCSILPMEAANG